MALAVEANSNTGALVGPSTPVVFAHTVTAANRLYVEIGTGAGALGDRQMTGVTYNGVALTLDDSEDDGGWSHAERWVLNNPPVGTFNVSISFTGAPNQMAAGASGVTDAGTAGTPVSATNTTANPSVTVGSTAGDLVLSFVCSDSAASTMTANGTERWEVEDIGTDIDVSAQRQTASGASTNCAWTCSDSGSGWCALGIAISALAAANTTVAWLRA